ncbi:MAG: flagellin [Gammaproteobacteria bacterium]|jgi:flagellin
MPAVVNTNIMSLNAQRNLNNSQNALATSIQRLSSGMRINSAKDDAAGLAISERMTAQIRGLNQAVRNSNDGISLAQTAEGALSEISNNLQRIRELAVQSANGTNNSSDRAALDAEAQQLVAEIERVANQTAFNGTSLLDGSFASVAFQVGANVNETITIASIVDANVANLGTTTKAQTTGAAATGFAVAIVDGDFTVNGTSIGAVAAAASATERASQMRDAVNAVADTTGVYATNDTATTVTLTSDATIAVVAATTGVVANSGFSTATGSATAATTTGFTGLAITTAPGANTAIASMDAALDAVNGARATLGAVQNRFESTIANLSSTSENLSAARSRIQDADFAAETASMTRGQILQQAGTAMVAQANSLPQSVLSLLG